MIIKKIEQYHTETELGLLREAFMTKWTRILGTSDTAKIDSHLGAYEQTTERRFAVYNDDEELVAVFGVDALDFPRSKVNTNRKYQSLDWWERFRWQLGTAFLGTEVQHDELYISFLAVAERFRGQGYGAEIVEVISDMARRAQKRVVTLYVAKTNEAAIRLYQHCGFQVAKTESYWLTRFFLGEADWLLMQKEV